MIVAGVDPGGAATGYAVVDTGSRAVLLHALVERGTDGEGDYLTRCADELIRTAFDTPVDLVAVEGLVHPNPHLGLANVTGLLGCATVRGYLLAYLHAEGLPVEHVRPGGHGSSPAAAYPPELIGPREGRKLTGKLRHVRSAYDVALTGAHLRRHPALRP